jgi:hypothetical protein
MEMEQSPDRRLEGSAQYFKLHGLMYAAAATFGKSPAVPMLFARFVA